MAKRTWPAVLCVAALALAVGPGVAQAAFNDPIGIFKPEENSVDQHGQPVKGVPPGTGFDGPCGVAIDSASNFYVSDYYHDVVDVFGELPLGGVGYLETQLTDIDSHDGPCGLAVDSAGHLYVNDFHRSVIRYTMSAFPPASGTTFGGETELDSNHSTGVAVSPLDNDVYVDDGTYVTAYEPSGSQVLDGGQPLKIGLGNLGEAFGVAVSGTGVVYVADTSTDTVKGFDPQVSKTTPVVSISKPAGGFSSLVDSAIAVDRVTGEIYVADRTGTRATEHPEATIYVFEPSGLYRGRLKYNVVDGLPVGLAVDNSAGSQQGQVYVTTGNTSHSRVYIYPAGAASAVGLPANLSLLVAKTGNGQGVVRSKPNGLDCAATCEAELGGGTVVTLTAKPDADSAFSGWSGAGCSGTGECVVTMDRAQAVSAQFTEISAPDSPPSPPSAPEQPVSAGPRVATGAQSRPHHRRHKAGHRHRTKRGHRAGHAR